MIFRQKPLIRRRNFIVLILLKTTNNLKRKQIMIFDNARYAKMPLDNEVKRVKATHHVRNICINKLLRKISDEEIKKQAEKKREDVYSFGRSNLPMNESAEFLTCMFDQNEAKKQQMFVEKKTGCGHKDNFSYRRILAKRRQSSQA